MLDLGKIDELSSALDIHLKKLASFTDALKDVKVSLDLLRNSHEATLRYELSKLQIGIESITKQLKNGTCNEYEYNLTEIKSWIEQGDWPLAVEPNHICNSEEKAQYRSGNILDTIVAENLKDKKFLDYGCGQGHTVNAANIREASVAIGYDIKTDLTNNQITNNFEFIKAKGPYDVILIYDVLDHIQNIDPVEALKQVTGVLAPGGKIYITNHPWSSRHGGHLYNSHNFAFLHLILDEVELTRCFGIQPEHNIKIVTPLETYRHWFNEANLSIKSELISKTPVEEFFTKPSIIKEKLAKHWPNPDLATNYMEIDFVEYILENKYVQIM